MEPTEPGRPASRLSEARTTRDTGAETPAPKRDPFPKLRPYQLPATEAKARADRDAADRAERLHELQQQAHEDASRMRTTAHQNRGQAAGAGGKAPKRHRLRNFFLWMVLIVLLTAAIGGALYWFLLRKQTPAGVDSADNTGSQAVPAAQTASPPTAAAAPTKSYNSTNFKLSFDYPESWVVTDTANKLTVVSSAMKLKAADGQSQQGQTTVTIQNKQISTPAFTAGNATAIRESQKIAYDKPSQDQRANTYLSFLNYAASTATGLDGVYVTGDNGYTEGQAIPQVDIAKADPLITVTFTACADTKCTTPGKALTLSASAWDDTTLGTPVTALLKSLVVE